MFGIAPGKKHTRSHASSRSWVFPPSVILTRAIEGWKRVFFAGGQKDWVLQRKKHHFSMCDNLQGISILTYHRESQLKSELLFTVYIIVPSCYILTP
jgi:hypothetical protein